jgi:hypothetical protein
MRRHFWLLFLITIFAALSLKSIFNSGMMQTHDGLWQVQRATAMFESLQGGQFPVRWVYALDNGHGIPLFNFVYPLPFYLSSVFMALGVINITAIKLVTIIGYLLGGLGMYLLFRQKRYVGLVVSLLYLLNPYQLVNIFVRGALGEVLVLGLAPWCLLVVQELKHRRIKWYDPIPLALSLLAHNFLGLLLLPVLLGYGVVSQVGKKYLPVLILSLGLASFFLVPMIFERSLLLSGHTQDYSYSWSDHFIYPSQLLYSQWDYWYSMPGIEDDGMTFQLGLASILMILVFSSWISLRANLDPKPRLEHYYWFLTLSLVILAMIPAGRFLWELFPILQAMQFPWRLLGISAIITSFITGSYLLTFAQKHRVSTLTFSLILLAIALFNTKDHHSPIKHLTADEHAALNQIYLNKTATSYRSEIMPKWATIERYQPDNLRLFNPRLGILEGNAKILEADDQNGNLTFQAMAENERATVVYYQNYYPSWAGTLGGQPHSIYPTETGEIAVPLKEGLHEYEITNGSTQVQSIANLISLISALSLLVFAFVTRSRP